MCVYVLLLVKLHCLFILPSDGSKVSNFQILLIVAARAQYNNN